MLASTLPTLGDRPGMSIGVAFEPAVGVDLTLANHLTFGMAAAVSTLDPETRGHFLIDAFGLAPVVQQDNFRMALLGGVWGDSLPLKNGQGLPVGVQGGLTFAYQVSPELIFRLNVVGGYGFGAKEPNRNIFSLPPAAGIEIGYRVDDNLSVTLGYNGHGNILGIRWRP